MIKDGYGNDFVSKPTDMLNAYLHLGSIFFIF